MTTQPEAAAPQTEAPKGPTLEDFRKKVKEGVEKGSPSEQGLSELRARIVVALNDLRGDNRFGTLGLNYSTAHQALEKTADGTDVITLPTKTEEVKRGLEGVLKETGIDGGRLDLSLPADTPPEKRTPSIRTKLKEVSAGLGKKVAEHLTREMEDKRAVLLYEEEKAGPAFADINVSRNNVRKLAFRLESMRDEFEDSITNGVGKLVGFTHAEDVIYAYREQNYANTDLPPFDSLPADETKSLVGKSKDRIFAEIPHVKSELKAKLDPNAEVFTRIAVLDRKIAQKHLNLMGQKEQKEGDRTTKPEIAGAYKRSAREACETIDEIKELQLSRKYYLGEVRVMLAQKRLDLANDNYKLIRFQAGRTLEGKEITDVFKARLVQIGARLNLLKERFGSGVAVINADTENKIDLAKDYLVKLNPFTEKGVSKEDVISKRKEVVGILKRAKETKGRSVVKEVKESPFVTELRHKREGKKATRRVESLRARKEKADGRYETWINYKDGLRRAQFEIKLQLSRAKIIKDYAGIALNKLSEPQILERASDSLSNVDDNVNQVGDQHAVEARVISKFGEEMNPKNFSEEEKRQLMASEERVKWAKSMLKKLGEGEENIQAKRRLLAEKMKFNPWYRKIDKHLEEEVFGKKAQKSTEVTPTPAADSAKVDSATPPVTPPPSRREPAASSSATSSADTAPAATVPEKPVEEAVAPESDPSAELGVIEAEMGSISLELSAARLDFEHNKDDSQKARLNMAVVRAEKALQESQTRYREALAKMKK